MASFGWDQLAAAGGLSYLRSKCWGDRFAVPGLPSSLVFACSNKAVTAQGQPRITNVKSVAEVYLAVIRTSLAVYCMRLLMAATMFMRMCDFGLLLNRKSGNCETKVCFSN